MPGFWTIVGILALAVVVLAILNRRALGRMIGAASAQVGEWGRAAQNADPMAIYRERIDDAVENGQAAQKSLESCKTLVNEVQGQVDSGLKEKARLETRIKTALANGDPNNTARGYAEQLAHVEEQLGKNQQQLAKHKTNYDNFLKKVRHYGRKVKELRQEAHELGIELEQSEREKEMNKDLQALQDLDTSFGGDLAQARAAVKQKIAANRAVGDVAADLSQQGLAEAADEDLERQAKADDILARFKTQQPSN